MSIKVSVLMPSLNVVEYIDEAISSVRNQSIKEIEILCIDAGSTDGTVEIIKKHCNEDSRVQYIESDKRSYGYQVNLGISILRGKYFGIVETDDYVEPTMYEKLFEAAEEDALDFVKANYKAFITQHNGEKFFLNRKNFAQKDLYNTVLCPRKYVEVATGDWYNCQGIYNSDFIRGNNITFSETKGAAFQDIGFLYYAIIKAEKVKYLEDSFYRYRIDRMDSSSNSGIGIKYSYDEFKRLVEKIKSDKSIDYACKKVLYIRMSKSFISSYGDIRRTPIALNTKEKERYYKWFKTTMLKAIEDEILNESDMPTLMWEEMVALLECEDKLREFQMENDLENSIRSKYADNKKVFIFGCGNYGYRAYKDLIDFNIKITAFLDNNKELWGKTFEDIIIQSPGYLREYKGDVLVIIANELHSKEMKNQLIELGVMEKNILKYGRQ